MGYTGMLPHNGRTNWKRTRRVSWIPEVRDIGAVVENQMDENLENVKWKLALCRSWEGFSVGQVNVVITYLPSLNNLSQKTPVQRLL